MLGLIGGVRMSPNRVVRRLEVRGSEEARVAADHHARVFASKADEGAFWRD